ncbi:hypothetical protein K1719_029467 [Acacia pycnantha]|nr:hypothetical protein K1719_029467 [Acacia pycnantha]
MAATQERIPEQTERVVDISLDDPHPRVRWAAIQVILSSLLDHPKEHVQYLIKFLPRLVTIIRSSASIYPRVQYDATIAVRLLINKCDNEEVIRSFSEDLVPELLRSLEQGGVFRVDAMEILRSLAISFPVIFRNHYKETVDSLKPHVSQWFLGAKSIECLSYVFSWFLKDQSLFVLSDAEKVSPLLTSLFRNTDDNTFDANAVKMASVNALPNVLLSCQHKKEYQELINSTVQALVQASQKETEREVDTEMLKSLNACIAISGSVFNLDVIKQIAVAINQQLSQGTIYWPFNLDHNVYDMEQQEEIIQVCVKILHYFGPVATKCLETMINTLKSAFLPHVDELLPAVQALWEAARAIGLCATNTQLISNFDALKAINNLYHVIGCALESERRMTYDAAVSALGKICEFRHDIINGPQVVPIWINFLPLRNDFEEAKYAHQQLCRLLDTADPDILELDNKNLEMLITQILNKVIMINF